MPGTKRLTTAPPARGRLRLTTTSRHSLQGVVVGGTAATTRTMMLEDAWEVEEAEEEGEEVEEEG